MMLRAVWLLSVTLWTAGCGAPDSPVAELSGGTMGTTYSIKVAPAPEVAQREGLRRLIEARLAEINQQMSTYLADSDLTRFNRASTTEWQPVPSPLIELVRRARRVSELSDGLYDITVGPLVDLWGFGSTGSRDSPPDDEQIRQRLPQVGYRHLQTREAPPAMRKAVPGLQVDLSSIAKGWAVDQVAQLLAGRGYEHFLIEIGGELYARGERAPGRPWRVAIERPLDDRREALRVVELRDMAMATSGDYRNFFKAGNERYAHTIDPRSGQAFRHRLAAVTVFAPDCTDADAWATALLALGEERGPVVADAHGLMALFVERTSGEERLHPSAALRASALWQPGS